LTRRPGRGELLAFHDFPAEHWISLDPPVDHNRSDSTCSTVKLRTNVNADQGQRGAGSPAAAITMVFKLVESAQARWLSALEDPSLLGFELRLGEHARRSQVSQPFELAQPVGLGV
jgi:hypothetical protein